MPDIDTHQKAKSEFLKRAGIEFKNNSMLETAFTHRSYINESRLPVRGTQTGTAGTHPSREHNERLEFLGDAVLELVVTDHLFKKYPHENEGALTSYRAALVNAVMLADIAEKLGVNDCLLLSKGEARDLGRARASILANAFEAIVGALYLDQGYTAADDFINRHVVPHIGEVIETGAWRDAKSAFQEFAQDKYGFTPRYDVVRSEGPDHDKHFVVAVSVGDIELGQGTGKSKQEAEQEAAQKALDDK